MGVKLVLLIDCSRWLTNTGSVWFTSKFVRCFPPLGFGDHSCQLAWLLVGMLVHSEWSLFGFLGTAICFLDPAQASKAPNCCSREQRGALLCSAGCCGSPWEAERRQGRVLALSWLTQALCSMGALICWSCQTGIFCEHKILFKNPKQTNKSTLRSEAEPNCRNK